MGYDNSSGRQSKDQTDCLKFLLDEKLSSINKTGVKCISSVHKQYAELECKNLLASEVSFPLQAPPSRPDNVS